MPACLCAAHECDCVSKWKKQSHTKDRETDAELEIILSGGGRCGAVVQGGSAEC